MLCVQDLHDLHELHVAGNFLKAIPNKIFLMHHLKMLSCNNNLIEESEWETLVNEIDQSRITLVFLVSLSRALSAVFLDRYVVFVRVILQYVLFDILVVSGATSPGLIIRFSLYVYSIPT